jgi:hypothetical protein
VQGKIKDFGPIWPIPAQKKTSRIQLSNACAVLFSKIREGFLDTLVAYIYTNFDFPSRNRLRVIVTKQEFKCFKVT